jgi:hypothetical protein
MTIQRVEPSLTRIFGLMTRNSQGFMHARARR